MRRLEVLAGLQPANALEQLAEQVGGTYHLNVLVVRSARGSSVEMTTLVNHGSPGDTQHWYAQNMCEVSMFSTSLDGFDSQIAAMRVEELLLNGEWYGAATPYYAEA